MEEFRQQVVDRVVLKLLSTKQIGPDAVDEEGLIRNQPLVMLLDALEERLNSFVYFNGRRMKLSTAIRMQARRIVQHVLKTKTYSPFYLRY
jgi:CRISPR/Cas system-associated endonuclease Cas1